MKTKKYFDVMEHLRQPHGIAILVLFVGILAWGGWTLWAARL